MESKKYATDLSDNEWGYIKPYLPVPTGRGRPKIHGSRAILDALFYVLKTGCPWRLCRKTSRLGKASTTGSGSGASMVPSSGSTLPARAAAGPLGQGPA